MDSMLDDIELFKDQLISFETSVLAKEKGFDYLTRKRYSKQGFEINVIDYYKDNREHVERYNRDTYPCITQSLLQKWIREKFKISIEVAHSGDFFFDLWDMDEGMTFKKKVWADVYFSSYEEALEQALLTVLKLI